MKLSTTFISTALAALVPALQAGVTMTPLTTFGGGDGWRAPGEIVTDDAAGTNNGTTYNYLGTGSLERGLAYSATHDRILLMSRNGGTHIRMLDPLTGKDDGTVPTTGITNTSTFALSHIACAADGTLYGANLTTNATTSAFRVFRWSDLDSAPADHFNSAVAGFTGTPRLGDSFDMYDSGGGSHTLVVGAAGVVGYLTIPAASTANVVGSFTPGGPVASDFRPGVTFGPGGASEVWGKAQNGSFRRTTYAGTAGAGSTTSALAGTQEGAMDVATVNGVALLATLEMNTAGGAAGRPLVRIYDVSTPSAPALAASGHAVTGTLATNTNAAGTIKWGAISGSTAKLYAMATNQGIQAFTLNVTQDIVPPVISSSPGNRSVYDRGQTTFTVSATGSPPFSYAWTHEGSPVGTNAASYTISTVAPGSAGSYVCRVSNTAGFADSTPAVLTVLPSVNTAALTPCWQLPPGARPYLSATGDTERGVDYNPLNNRLYLASRNPSTQIQVLDGITGADVNPLNLTGVSGGNFPLMFTGVAADGVIYACNLSNTGDGSSFKIYQWSDDAPVTLPATVYDGNPIGSRIGDNFDVRGSGANTECLAGARNTNQFVIFKPDGAGFLIPTAITVTGAPNSAFGLGIAFGAGKTVWGKNGGGQLLYCSYDDTAGTGAIIASYGAAQGVTINANPLGVDSANGCLALIEVGNSDNVRFFSYTGDTPALTLLDQEFFSTDNANGNGVGSVYVGAGKVYALDTNNGLVCYSTLKPALPTLGAITPGPAGNFSVEINGTPGFHYVVESTTDLAPLSWAPLQTILFDTTVETAVIPMSDPRRLYRARLGP